jgi:hypothetical protein
MQRRFRAIALTLALGGLWWSAPAGAELSCEPPSIPFQDAEGSWFCAASEPNVSCYEDVPPRYDPADDSWHCPSIEDAKKLLARLAGPNVSCASEELGEAAHWDEDAGEWRCPPAPTACALCENRFELCKSDVGIAKESCIARGRVVAHAMCTGDGAVNWRGQLVDLSQASCVDSKVYDARNGKHRTVKKCSGAVVDECVTGFLESHPGEAVASNVGGKVGLSGTVKGKAGVPLVAEGEVSVTGSTELSAGRTWTSTWGGGVGIASACNAAAAKAAESCTPCNEVCSE